MRTVIIMHVHKQILMKSLAFIISSSFLRNHIFLAITFFWGAIQFLIQRKRMGVTPKFNEK